MTNNIDLFRKYLSSFYPDLEKNPDVYFVIELIRRGKDNPDLPAANYKFKTYYVNSLTDIDRFEEEIISVCNLLRLRAYFSINKKSYQQVMLNTANEYTRRLALRDYKKPHTIWESCSGSYLGRKDKRWVVDIDEDMRKEDYIDLIGQDNILTEFPTKSGLHLITKPFNLSEFWKICDSKELKKPDILKNHLSLLYENIT